jgi:uridine phosphorylase
MNSDNLLAPILEFDPALEAMIEPSKVIRPRDVPEHCVFCWFREVMDKVVAEKHARVLVENRWEDGPHPLYEIEVEGRRVAFIHAGIGSMAASMLEEVIAFGCQKFIAAGGCGVLQKDIEVGRLVVVSAAVRDEGASYHYLPPGREVIANPLAIHVLETTLRGKGLPYHLGKTWTTDAPYRETPQKVAARRHEGCLTVEMEAAGLMAVAQFRNVVFGQVLYGGDDLSGAEWSNRGWQSRQEIRESLFWLAVEACFKM